MHPYIAQRIFHQHMHYSIHSLIHLLHKAQLRNIGPPAKVHNTQLRKRMENTERTESKSQYKKELEVVRSDVARLASLLGKTLRARDGEGMSAQTDEAPLAVQSLVAPQNIGTSTPKKHLDPTRPTQIPITMDLTAEDPQDVRFSDHMGYDKWTALEERLRAIEGNDLLDLV